MKTRFLSIIIALLGLAVGAEAQDVYSLEIYDGKTPNSVESSAIAALVQNGDLTMEKSGNVQTYKRSGTTLFTYNSGTVSVPRTVTSTSDFISKALNSTAMILLGNVYKWIHLNISITINSQNFPDANFRSYVKTFDTNSDGRLALMEIGKVDGISCNGKSISSLTGIEFFTLADILNVQCYNNSLSTIDVSKISNLVTLHCYGNQLKSLDVSKNNKLVILTCQNNQLTSLKVSASAGNLKEIRCYGNNLSGSSMDAFISSLPTVSGGILYVKDASLSKDNTMTSAQVEAVGEKGWVPKIKNGSSWLYYHGSDAIAINTTNFPDGNFKSWVKSNCDKDGDGYLSTKEIAAVKSMNVSGQSISNLKGIEYFTALTTLNCSSNQLSSLDLSKNTALVNLYCSNNQLTSLKVSTSASSLRLIECYKNNLRGTAVDNLISSLPKKSGADLNFYYSETSTGNYMTSAQVQAAKQKLWTPREMGSSGGTSSWVEYTPPIAIDATNFPDANFRSWVSSNCDTDKNGYLSTPEIEAVKSMNVSGKSISNLKGIEFFTALTWLECSSNSLTSLDLSKNTALKELSCFSNQLKSLDLSKNTALTGFICSNNQLTSLKVSASASSLNWIDCYKNNLRGTAIDNLISSLPTTKSNACLNFYDNEASTGNSMTAAQVKAAKQKDWKVYMKETGLGDDGFYHEGWVSYPGSDAIAVNSTNFPDAAFRSLVSYRDQDEDGYLTPDEIAAVTSLSIASNGIGNLKGIEFFTALTSLNCYGNQLTSLDLSKNTKLKTLQCSQNQLRSLIVSKNAIGMTSINCDGNRLSGTAVDNLISSLPEVSGDMAFYNNETSMGNAMSVEQVQAALDKGWAVYMWNAAMNDWVPYLGEIVDGDANGDGEVDEVDLDMVRNIILGITPSGTFHFEAADLNADGTVDIVDLTKLIKKLKK